MRLEMPPELEGDEGSAWRWLVKNRPKLFAGLNVSKLPFYYLIDDRDASVTVEESVCGYSVCDVTVNRNKTYCSPAHRQAAYRERKAA